MRLISATVKNYRVHKERTVEFDPARTLIGGPNESGKSTFIEAVHRGLFLKSRVTGQLKDSMSSLIYSGVPQVEVCFEVNGQRYRLVKEFNGIKGTTILTEVGGKTWQGEEAELILASLLKVRGISGKTTRNAIQQQWAHLWVWQGKGGEDPAEDVSFQHERLLKRLQEVGGALVMQSEEDSRVANRFAEAVAHFYSSTGKVRKGSELAKAEERLQEAEGAYREACQRLQELEKAVEEYQEASEAVERYQRELGELSRELEDVKKRLERLSQLRQEEKEKTELFRRAKDELEVLKERDEKIRELKRRSEELLKSLEPKRKREEELKRHLHQARERLKEAKLQYETAVARSRRTRLRKDLAAAWVAFFEKWTRRRELRARWRRVAEIRRQVEELETTQARLPKVDGRSLSNLRKKVNELSEARVALKAMAAEVRVLESPYPVQVGEDTVAPGGHAEITDITEVSVGDEVRLEIRPGGGKSLSSHRNKVEELERTVEEAMGKMGVSTLEEAEEALELRKDLEAQRKKLQALLDELDPQRLGQELRQVKVEVLEALSRIRRHRNNLKAEDEGEKSPSSLQAAKDLLSEVEKEVEGLEDEERNKKAVLSKVEREEQKVYESLQELVEEMKRDEETLSNLESNAKMLEEEHGDPAQRAKALAEAREKVDKAKAEAEKVARAIEELQPQMLEPDHERLKRALEEKREKMQEAKERIAASKALLVSSGEVDPKVQVEEAEARLKLAKAHYDRVNLKARALRLAHGLFQEKQQELADTLSAPLAEKITRYLQCLFPRAEAQVVFEENRFKEVKLVRKDADVLGALSFEELSGGTKEQLAAAVRLAIAELLADDHGGSLPVVFDDAFVNTDPHRGKVVQRMLDLASSRGLQVIVLTSNPSDYSAFGAKEVTFEKATFPLLHRPSPG